MNGGGTSMMGFPGAEPLVMRQMPRQRAIIREQLRMAAISLREFLIGLLMVAGVFDVSMIVMALQRMHPPRLTASLVIGFNVNQTLVMVAVALLLPFFLWQGDTLECRGYHASMPVARARHAFLRTLAGWCYAMAVTLLFVVNASVIGLATAKIQGMPFTFLDENLRWWHYLVPFTSASIAYTFSSAAVVGARRAIVWIAGVATLLFALIALSGILHLHEAYRLLLKAWIGSFGLFIVLGGFLSEFESPSGLIQPAGLRWMGSLMMWGALAGISFLVATRRRPDL